MLLLVGIVSAALISLYFSSLAYALRDFSRARLEDLLRARRKDHWLEYIVGHETDLILVAAVPRMLANTLIVIASVQWISIWSDRPSAVWWGGFALAAVVTLLCSVAIPAALAAHLGEPLLAISARVLHMLRIASWPIIGVMHWIDDVVRSLAGPRSEPEPDQLEKDILSVVEEGEKEGVVDTQERQMIESVIELHDRQVDQIMTARPEIVALEIIASLPEIKQTIETSGHSRIPVYDGTLDHIAGILYARDLLKHIGEAPEKFDIRSAMRAAIFVPETKPLRDLLRDFKLQKVHIAIVLDEYGGTAGLVTIEDILEELVGEIRDEHEPPEPAMLRRIDRGIFEADARIYIDELNRQCGLTLPEDAGYETLGGFISTTLGRIPQKGASFDNGGVRYSILDSEPQRIKRVRIETAPQAAPKPA
jgi:putative hemolysin